MTDSLFYKWQRDALRPPDLANPVKCPACDGAGVLVREKHAETRCLSCRATGKVEADRVCGDCKRFKGYCICHHNEIEPTAEPKRGRRAFGHTTMRRGHAQSARGKVTR